MGIFGIDKRNATKRQIVDLPASTPSRKKGLIGKASVIQGASVEKRFRNSGEKRWYKFAYWQELTQDVFNIFNNH